MEILDSVKEALNEIKNTADAKTIIGDAITVGEVTLIPVSKISIGVGLGGGAYAGKSKGTATDAGGGGTGMTISPVAFIVVGADGEVKLLNVSDCNCAGEGKISGTVNQIDKALDSVPGIISKTKEIFSGKKKTTVTTEEKEEINSDGSVKTKIETEVTTENGEE